MSVPAVQLGGSCSRALPVLGLGTGGYPFSYDARKKLSVLHAIEFGYRHFDAATLYHSEQAVGEAISEALQRGLINSRSDLFITSKLWCTDAHPHLVLPALRESLRNLKTDYLDLYLIHWPMSLQPGACPFPINSKDILPLDLISVWGAMEDCQRLGLARSIGVSNFTTKKIKELLAISKIPPAVNQVEMNPLWQQVKLKEFCKEKGIHIIAHSPLGGRAAPSSKNLVMESEVLKDIAEAKGKSVAQETDLCWEIYNICKVSLRWIYEQGVSTIVKSMNKERLKENMQIFDWELSDEDRRRISQILQCKKSTTCSLLSPESCPSTLELLDVEIIE